ncbi:MAG: hypothetical protein ACLFV7_12705 [Phycisphaerae bacterium]
MRFIKDNLFLVILAAGTIVLCGVILLLNSRVSAQIEEEVEDRASLSGELKSLAGRPYINEEIINQRREEVDRGKQVYETLLEKSLTHSNRYEVLQLVRSDTGEKIAAFPFNRELDREISLRAVFPDAYNRAMNELAGLVKSTRAPVGEVSEVQIRQWETKILANRRTEWSKAVQRGDIEPTETVDGKLVSTEPVMTQEITELAIKRAQNERVVNRATAGEMYMDPGALHRVIPPGTRRPLLTNMWNAQIGLWIQRDVLAAINATNAEVFQGLTEEQKNVMSAAVKRLVEIRVAPEYFPMTGGGGGGDGVFGRGSGEESFRGGQTTSVANTLTQSVSNPRYDVMQYTFTVVMPFRHLAMLEAELCKRNYHTVLDVVEMATPADADNRFFYGREPVLRIRLKCELKLLTGWERPLMPAEVLQLLPQDALRPEDSERLRQVSPAGY